MTKKKKHLRRYSKSEIKRAARVMGSQGGRKKAARQRRKRRR